MVKADRFAAAVEEVNGLYRSSPQLPQPRCSAVALRCDRAPVASPDRAADNGSRIRRRAGEWMRGTTAYKLSSIFRIPFSAWTSPAISTHLVSAAPR